MSSPLAESAGFNLLRADLAGEIRLALTGGLAGGVTFHEGGDPLTIFRGALAAAIRDIETHPRGRLFPPFLLKGPYEDSGPIPEEVRAQRLTDAETAKVINFIMGHMVKSFQGALAELLAVAPCLGLLQDLQREGIALAEARWFVGDAVKARQLRRNAFAKAADLHLLVVEESGNATVHGVVEVKSYFVSPNDLAAQIAQHRERALRGLRMGDRKYAAIAATAPAGVTVAPDTWPLPRTLRWEESAGGRRLHLDAGSPARERDLIERPGESDWRITLRWSYEARTAEAYNMTFWYMGKVGEVIYADKANLPSNWSEMTPAEAGANAAKQMLYYATLRARDAGEFQRAVALYNTYGFGYALGMNYRDQEGKQDMLFPEDLDEIATHGVTKHGGRFVDASARAHGLHCAPARVGAETQGQDGGSPQRVDFFPSGELPRDQPRLLRSVRWRAPVVNDFVETADITRPRLVMMRRARKVMAIVLMIDRGRAAPPAHSGLKLPKPGGRLPSGIPFDEFERQAGGRGHPITSHQPK